MNSATGILKRLQTRAKYLVIDSSNCKTTTENFFVVTCYLLGSDDPVSAARGCTAALSNLNFKDIKTCAQVSCLLYYTYIKFYKKIKEIFSP